MQHQYPAHFVKLGPRGRTLWKYWERFWRVEKKHGFVSFGIPLGFMLFSGMYVGCVILDKQKEIRHHFTQQVSLREQAVEDEKREMLDMLLRNTPSYQYKMTPLKRPTEIDVARPGEVINLR